tara:strand:+ start:3596 stop:4441 length:846 start_codon:yes stop_codon:yes gene_type:complete
MKIAVITVLYHKIYKFNKQIQILKSISKDIDIVVINNNSPENIPDYIIKNCDKYIYSSVNLGYGGGSNLGIKYALKKNYNKIWLINHDIITNKKLIYEMLELSKNFNVVTSPMFFKNGLFETDGTGKINYFLGTGFTNKIKNKMNYFNLANCIFDIDVFKKIGLFDEENFFLYWEDVDLCKRFFSFKEFNFVVSKNYAVHDDNIEDKISNKMYKIYLLSTYNFFLKNTPFRLGIITCLVSAFVRSIKRLFSKEPQNFFICWYIFFQAILSYYFTKPHNKLT